MEESSEIPKTPYEVREEKLVPSSAEIVWRSDRFLGLPTSETIFSWCLPDKELEKVETVKKAFTLGQMGRDVGWGFMVFENNAGERFTFLGVKGVGITEAGREFMTTVPKPVTYLESIRGEGGTMETVYDLKKKERFIPPQEGESLPVLGFVGLKEVEQDRKNATKLIKEGFWTAEPVMILTQEDSKVVKEAKEKGLIPKDEHEGREVRAFRNPLRLNALSELYNRPKREREENLEKIKDYLELSSRMVEMTGEKLEGFGQEDEVANYVLWYFNRLGKQFGVMARVGFRHENLMNLQNTTLAGEIVDLGTETKWPELRYSYERVRETLRRYRDGLNMASAIYASATLVGKEINLEEAVSQFHKAFITECDKREGFKKDIIEEVASDRFEREEWLNPEVSELGLVRTTSFGAGEWNYLGVLGYLPEERRRVEWPKGRVIDLPKDGYIDFLRYCAGKCWQKEADKLMIKSEVV